MLQELGVGYIQARSPQAKGRIERLWATLQDRLVSELRLRGVATRAAANAFLPRFLADFNRRFSRAAQQAHPVWRRPPRDLELVLSAPPRSVGRPSRRAPPRERPFVSASTPCADRSRRGPAASATPPTSVASRLRSATRTACRLPAIPRMTFSRCSTHDILLDQRHEMAPATVVEYRALPEAAS